jgi:hypothetical protein
MSIKNSNDTIGNRCRDLSVCSAVPQPTAPPRAPLLLLQLIVVVVVFNCCNNGNDNNNNDNNAVKSPDAWNG